MRKILVFSAIAALAVPVLFLAGCQPSPEEVPKPAESPRATEEDAIRKIAADVMSAWNTGDAGAYAALFATDADFIGPSGERFESREEIEKNYADLFAGSLKGTNLTSSITSIRFLQADVTLVDGTYEITGSKDAEGQDMPPMKGLYTSVIVKQGDKWLRACHRPMVPIEVPGAE